MLQANKDYTWGNGINTYRLILDGAEIWVCWNETPGEFSKLPAWVALEHIQKAHTYTDFRYLPDAVE